MDIGDHIRLKEDPMGIDVRPEHDHGLFDEEGRRLVVLPAGVPQLHGGRLDQCLVVLRLHRLPPFLFQQSR